MLPGLPVWIKKEEPQRVTQSITYNSRRVPNGGRNNYLTSVAGTMWARGMVREAVEAALQAENIAVCTPPLDGAEVSKIAGSIANYPRQLPVSAPSSASVLPADLKILTASELLASPPLRWRVKNILPETGLAAVYGLSGTGKTFIVLALSVAIASGSRWFGHRVFSAPVLYCALEGEGGIRNRVQAHLQHFGTVGDSVRFLAVPFSILVASDVDRLAAAIIDAQGKGGVVFIDTLNRAAPGADENSPDGMGAIIAGAAALQRQIEGLVVVVHHTGKDTSKGPRGHYSLFAALDAAIEVQRGPDSRSWKVAKAKDGEDGQEFAFKLDVVELGFDEDGDPITSCVVREISPGSARRVPTAKLQRQVFDAIDSLRPLGPVTTDVVINCVTPLIAFDPAKRDRRRDSIIRAINELAAGGFITVSDGVIL